ncbi:MAG: cytochrome c oxidase subunit 3, partial [Rhodospirillales bacterium]|nr:cytochrome c oxidase subunit 3 [Rhodospirillales bacterium]
MSGAKSHPYHIVNPSPWPFVTSLIAFATAIAAILYMHGGALLYVEIGFAGLVIVAALWWRDVISEGRNGHDHTEEVRHGLRMGMLLFITSEVMFFFAFFWAYFNAWFPSISFVASPVWPPADVVPLATWH